MGPRRSSLDGDHFAAELRHDVVVECGDLRLHPIQECRQPASQDVVDRLACQHRAQVVEPTQCWAQPRR